MRNSNWIYTVLAGLVILTTSSLVQAQGPPAVDQKKAIEKLTGKQLLYMRPLLHSSQPILAVDEIKLAADQWKRVSEEDSVFHPAELTDGKELEKYFSNEKTRQQILSQVDFKTQKLICFSWNGSANDQLTWSPVINDKKIGLQFVYRADVESARQPKHQLFAIGKKINWTIDRAQDPAE